MKRGFIIILFLFPSCFFNAQEFETFDFQNSLGFGVANSINIMENFISNSNNRAALFIDYKKRADSVTCLRINIISDLPLRSNNNTITEINNCYISMGVEKRLLFIKNEKLNLFYGADLYYKLDVNKGRFAPLSTEQFGIGLLGVAGFELAINDQLSLASEILLGIGFHQFGVNNSSGIIEWGLKGVSPKNLSIGIRKFF
tara:strand:- start:217 stop:816 length:600 start_codon:yes stop_codon:yes gene_type:complete